MRNHYVKSATGNLTLSDGFTGPSRAVKVCYLVNIAGQCVSETVARKVRSPVEIDALDAGRNAVLEPIDDRKIARKIVP
jgi:hypothetical protein